MTRKSRIVTPALAAVIAATGLIALAGDLNPPPGAVAPTHKTLTEVEPRIAVNAGNTPGDADSLFKITLPGSYYLTGNITGVIGKHGVEIVASGVTLDLNGFHLAGGGAGMGAFDGVSVTDGGLTNIAVVNGSVRSWGGDSIDLGTFGAVNSRVADVLASGNAGNGIQAGVGCTVSNCSAYLNAITGISTGIGCTVSNCSATSNTGSGISIGTGCTVTNCSAYFNTGNGYSVSGGCTVSNCSAYQNTANGIFTGSGCTVSNCSALGNGGSGINVSTHGTVSSCSAESNGAGISTASGCKVTNCSASFNGSNGISVTFGCTVADCTARLNTVDGIVCGSQCIIRGSTCSTNGSGAGNGAGIHATSADNRIEGNNCTAVDRGIDVDGAGNFITRNTCSGNTTNWDVVAGNVILVVNATTAAAVSGNAGGTAPGSPDPNANFTY